MSSLTLSVLIVVAIGLAAIVGYNLWRRQERDAMPMGRILGRGGAIGSGSARRAPGEGLPGDTPDRTEPRMGGASGAVDGLAAWREAAAQAVAGSADAAPGVVPVQDPSTVGISLATDCVVELPLEEEMPGEGLIAILHGFRRVGAKPVIVEGRLGTDEAPQWGPLQAGASYRQLRVGVLLANRHGPLNAMEFSEFVGAIQALAEQLPALADTPEMNEVLTRARELDMLCAQLDAQIGINVEASEPIAGDPLAGMARTLGLHDRGAGRYARIAAGGEVLFTLTPSESGSGVSLLLDVPRAAASARPLDEMFGCARQLAERLGAAVVDDGGRPLSLEAIEAIGRQLDVRYASLESAGFPAGSALALRLFN